MNIPSARFGVKLIRFMKAYEANLLSQMRQLDDESPASVASQGSIDLAALIARHQDVLIWMRHERLVHLIVTCLSAVFLMFVAGLDFIFKGHPGLLILLAIAMILTLAYLIHYFQIENTVQRWHLYHLELLDHQRQQAPGKKP